MKNNSIPIFIIFSILFTMLCVTLMGMAYNRNVNIYIKKTQGTDKRGVLEDKVTLSTEKNPSKSSIETVEQKSKEEAVEKTEPAATEQETQTININKADINELISLPGIGKAIAERIVDYRSKNGDFSSIREIMQVSGIGENSFNKIKELITCG